MAKKWAAFKKKRKQTVAEKKEGEVKIEGEKIKCSSIKKLLKLSQSSIVTKLSLVNCTMKDEDFKTIEESIINAPLKDVEINNLNFITGEVKKNYTYDMKISEYLIPFFIKLFQNNRFIEKVTFDLNSLNKVFICRNKNNLGLYEICVSGKNNASELEPLSEDGLRNMVHCIKALNINTCVIKDLKINDSKLFVDYSTLFEKIIPLESIKKLTLNNLGISGHELDLLLEFSPKSKLNYLSLENNKISSEDCRFFGKIIKQKMPDLKTINLLGNDAIEEPNSYLDDLILTKKIKINYNNNFINKIYYPSMRKTAPKFGEYYKVIFPDLQGKFPSLFSFCLYSLLIQACENQAIKSTEEMDRKKNYSTKNSKKNEFKAKVSILYKDSIYHFYACSSQPLSIPAANFKTPYIQMPTGSTPIV